MRAIGKNLLVTRQEQSNTTTGGIIFKDHSQVTKATVIAVGDDVTNIAVNDELVINWGATVAIKLGEVECFVVHVDNVFAVV